MFKVENEFDSPNIPKTVRFTESIDESLSTIAQKNNVSFNRLVLLCCKYALDNMEEEENK